jgi:hypothetical protein
MTFTLTSHELRTLEWKLDSLALSLQTFQVSPLRTISDELWGIANGEQADLPGVTLANINR